ncbi:MAG: DUF459 domain-containing protein [Acidothermus sp.]|nr:DUF459 domain-containing protein [Acidothermus sp.]
MAARWFRLGAASVLFGSLLAAGVGCSRGQSTAFGEGSPPAVAATSGASSPASPSGAASPSQGASSKPSGSASGLAPPTLPVTILEIGDSLGEDLGFGLRNVTRGNPEITVIPAAEGSSGLIQLQFVDWPRRLADLMSRYHPDVVIVFLGANDVQNFYFEGRYEKFGSPEWRSIYASRVDTMMREATAAGARLVWVGMPAMRDRDFDSSMRILDEIYSREAAKFPNAEYFDSRPVLAGPGGGYATTVTAPDGTRVVARAPDGIHITFGGGGGGGELLARAVLRRLGIA